MSLTINLHHLNDKTLQLEGEMSQDDLGIEVLDELVHPRKPLIYKLEAQKMGNQILINGTLEITLDCECARCLKPYLHPINLKNWISHIPLEGEEKALVVNDCVDLTPYVREDILLAFPQHPLCKHECGGLSDASLNPEKAPDSVPASAWAELNKLKFEE